MAELRLRLKVERLADDVLIVFVSRMEFGDYRSEAHLFDALVLLTRDAGRAARIDHYQM